MCAALGQVDQPFDDLWVQPPLRAPRRLVGCTGIAVRLDAAELLLHPRQEFGHIQVRRRRFDLSSGRVRRMKDSRYCDSWPT